MISTVLIDIDDTILDFNLCAEWAMERTAEKMGLSLPEGTYDCFKEINIALWKRLEKKEITTDDIYCVRWTAVAEAVGVKFDNREFESNFLYFLSHSIIPVNGAVELLKYLSGKYKIFVASNGPYEQQIQRMKLAGMDAYMSGYFVSEKIGHSKPSKEFFDVCFEETHVKSAGEMIMIGDSLSADIQGAHRYGIKTCWLDRSCTGTENCADYVVNNIDEIKEIL